jgi:exonuclease SbcC
MKLRSLRLQLFRQHVDGVVHFPDGLIGIIGTNGSGKTTIVEAVGFALFGSRALRGRVEDVRTRTAPSKTGRSKRDNEMRVELLIDHDTTMFRIERSLSDASLYVGGESVPVAQGNREVSARIAALVGMSYEEFVATYCTEQKGLEFLSGKKGTTEREKFIIRILGYDRLEDLQELLRNDRKDRRSTLQGYEASLGTREELEQRLVQEQEQHAAILARHDEAAKALTKAEDEFGVLRARMQKVEDARTRYMKEREAVQAIQVRLEERMKRRSSLADARVVAEDELMRASKPLVGTRAIDEVLAETKREHVLVKETAEKFAAELQHQEVAWREELSEFRIQREAVTKQAEQLTLKVKKIDSLDAGGECPTCSQPLGSTFEDVHSHLVRERDALVSRAEELRVLEQKKATLPPAVEEKRALILDTHKKLERLQTKLQDLQQCQQLAQKIQSVGADQRVVELDIRSAQENLERAEQRRKDCNFAEDEYLKEKGAHDAAQRLLEVTRLQRVRLEGEVNTHAALVARSKLDIERFDEKHNELQKIRQEVRLFDECDRIVTDFRRYVNAAIRPRMAELASEYLTDLTDGRYSAVELGEDFTPTVIEDGEAKRVISGGEEDILNLCMRIALSHMLAERAGQNFSLLMLDEVFGSLDEARRSNVLALLEKLRRRFEQIIIITHFDDIKDGVQHLIQVEYDEGHGSARIGEGEEDFDRFAEAVNI